MWTNKSICHDVQALGSRGTATHGIIQNVSTSSSLSNQCRYGGGNNEYAHIPTDGFARGASWRENSHVLWTEIGTWEGATLRHRLHQFDDQTWLGRGGLIHSGSMRIVEKLTRVGNEIRTR